MRERVALLKPSSEEKIISTVVNRKLSIEMDLEEFLGLVSKEIGPVTWIFRDTTFQKKFRDAVDKVVDDMKKSSYKVV